VRRRLRGGGYALADDHRLCRAVLAVFVRAMLAFERRRTRARGLVGRAGAVTAIQRCGSALNTNVHFHTRVIDEGVFAERPAGAQRFVAAPAPPTDVEMAPADGGAPPHLPLGAAPRPRPRCRAGEGPARSLGARRAGAGGEPDRRQLFLHDRQK